MRCRIGETTNLNPDPTIGAEIAPSSAGSLSWSNPAMLLRAVSACFLVAAASARPVNMDGELVLMTNSIHHADVRACEQPRT